MSAKSVASCAAIFSAFILIIYFAFDYFYVAGIKGDEVSGKIVSCKSHRLIKSGVITKAKVMLDDGQTITAIAACSCVSGKNVKVGIYQPLPFMYSNYKVICE